MKLYSVQLNNISKKLMRVSDGGKKHLLSKTEINYIDNLDNLTFEVRSPLQHLEHKLHSLIAYFILPIFAFANAGVVISLDSDFNFSLLINIAVCLFVGKMIGVAFFSFMGNKLGIIELPSAVDYKQILGISAIAGIGFTMSIFIGNLAFYGDLANINSAKIGIIIGSITSATVGYTILRLTSTNK